MVVSDKGDGDRSPPFYVHRGGTRLISPIRDPPGVSENDASALNGARRNLNLYLNASSARNVSQVSPSQDEQASRGSGSQRGRNNGHGQIYASNNLANFNASGVRVLLPFPVRSGRGGYVPELGTVRNGITSGRIASRHPRLPCSTLPLSVISRYRDIIADVDRNGFSAYRSELGHGNPLLFEFCNSQATPITRIRNASNFPRPEIDIFSGFTFDDYLALARQLRRGSGRLGGNSSRNASGRGRGSLANLTDSAPLYARSSNSLPDGTPPHAGSSNVLPGGAPPYPRISNALPGGAPPHPTSANSLSNGICGRGHVYHPGALQAEQLATSQNRSSDTVGSFFANRGDLPPDIAQRHFIPRYFNPLLLTIKQSCHVMATFDLDTHCSMITKALCMYTLRIYGLEECPISDLRLAVFFFFETHFDLHPVIELCVRNIPDKEANVVGVVFERISTRREILENKSVLNGLPCRVASNSDADWIIENYDYLADQQTDSNGSN